MSQEIIPAILPDAYEALSARLGEIARLARTAHIDTCDGVFVPRVSWPYGDTDTDGHFGAIQKEKEGLPFWDKLDFEVHLMVTHPERFIAGWISAGALRVIVHAEAVADPKALLKQLGDMTEIGIALKLETPLDAFRVYAQSAGTLHLMSIDKIGHQGGQFQESIFEKIREARGLFPGVSINVDGGVNLDNASALIDAGANRLIVGSALFLSEDVAATFGELEALIN